MMYLNSFRTLRYRQKPVEPSLKSIFIDKILLSMIIACDGIYVVKPITAVSLKPFKMPNKKSLSLAGGYIPIFS